MKFNAVKSELKQTPRYISFCVPPPSLSQPSLVLLKASRSSLSSLPFQKVWFVYSDRAYDATSEVIEDLLDVDQPPHVVRMFEPLAIATVAALPAILALQLATVLWSTVLRSRAAKQGLGLGLGPTSALGSGVGGPGGPRPRSRARGRGRGAAAGPAQYSRLESAMFRSQVVAAVFLTLSVIVVYWLIAAAVRFG